MNDNSNAQRSSGLQVIHALLAIVGVISLIPTGTMALKHSPYDGAEIIAFAAFTLATAHAALFLGQRAYAGARYRGQFVIFFALFVGYVCAAVGLSVCFH